MTDNKKLKTFEILLAYEDYTWATVIVRLLIGVDPVQWFNAGPMKRPAYRSVIMAFLYEEAPEVGDDQEVLYD